VRIIPRAEWGARYARGFGPAPLPAREVWLHHSVTAAPNPAPPFGDDDAAVRLLEDIGQQRFGGGISYTFAVTPSGRVYEGHGVDRRGAHTGGRNSISRAICLIGNYDVAAPPPAMLDAVVELLREGTVNGWWPAPRLAGGHRDAPGASTSCPGRFARAAIPTINERAAQEAELNADEARMLAEIHFQTTAALPNRRGAFGEVIANGGADTAFGYAINADGATFRVEREILPQILSTLQSIEARLTALEQARDADA
jgi:N-acetylmuramoyl-L-alanine amidase-like protein